MLDYTIAALVVIPLALFIIGQSLYCLRTINANQMCPAQLVDDFESHLNEKRYQEAYELAKNHNSTLGQALSAALSSIAQGYEAAKASVDLALDAERLRLEQIVTRMGFLALAAPICALLVSVFKLMRAFGNYAPTSEADDAAIRAGAANLSAEVSASFLCLGAGLLVCLVAIAAYFYFRGALELQLASIAKTVLRLLSRFQSVGKR